MRKAIVDTDILSEVLAGVNQKVIRAASGYVLEHGVLTFTSVTLYEIVTGLVQNNASSKLERVTRALSLNEQIVPDREDYSLAGTIRGTLRRVGKEVGYSDPLIAACAMRRSFVLVTGNQKHFHFIQREGFALNLEDWRE